MFQFLKQFFQKKTQPVEEVTVSFDKLEQWLSEQANHNSPKKESAIVSLENVHLINQCRDALRTLKDMLLTQQYLDAKSHEIAQLKEEERKQRETYAIKIEKLKKNPAFQQYAVQVEQRDALSRELEELQMKLEHLFVSLARLLKQLSQRTPDEQLVKNYLLHPTSTLLEDTPLSIARVLERVKEQLAKDTMVGDEQRRRYNHVLSLLSRDSLQQMQTRLAELQRKKTEHERSIRGNILMQEYNDLKYKYDHYDYKMRKHDVLLAELQKKHATLLVKDTLLKLQELLLQCTQKKVTLVFSEQTPPLALKS